jgi:hypothetical protein
MGTSGSFQFRNEQFFARSRKSRDCAEAYRGTSHKRSRRLTPRLRKRAIYGWKPANDQAAYIDSVALNLHGFYSGLERIFELIARCVDKTMPSGDLWHRDLLKRVSQEEKGVRPAVISTASLSTLDELRRFRHLVRNVYTFNLMPEKVEPIVSDLPALWSKVQAELLAFADFLEQTGQE